MNKFLLIIIFFSNIILAKEEVYLLPDSEIEQVNKLYSECGGIGWKINDGWPFVNEKFSSTFTPYGIEFLLSDEILSNKNDTITKRAFISEINLNSNNLSGEIPNISLPHLELLDLSYNNLSGEIPDFNLPELKELNLIINYLNGPLPNFNLPNLEILTLGGNEIGDTIPNFDLPELKFLSLRDNDLTGEIPDFDLPNLEMLNLRNNILRGEIPDFDLPKLTLLRLQTNGLSGNIPNFNLPELSQMYLSENLLSGNIPDFNLPKLDAIYLDNNNLSGEIPNFNLKKLRWAYFHNNQISGEIPDFNLPVLEVLSLQYNLFKGNIPDFNLPKLYALELAGNKFTFLPLETNLDKYQTYFYGDQDTILALIFSDNTFEVNVDGTQNSYTWFLNNQELTGDNSNSLPLYSEGIYYCEVRSSLLPDLILRSEDYDFSYKSVNKEINERINEFSLLQNNFANTIKIKSDKNKTIEDVEIYSLSGSLVLSKIINNNQVLLNTDNINSGVYFINIISDRKHYFQKIIIN